MHRNVIFKTDTVPETVFSAFEGTGEDLHKWLEENCTGDCSVLTIPHNSNLSAGLMFEQVRKDGQPIDEAYAMALDGRIRNAMTTVALLQAAAKREALRKAWSAP